VSTKEEHAKRRERREGGNDNTREHCEWRQKLAERSKDALKPRCLGEKKEEPHNPSKQYVTYCVQIVDVCRKHEIELNQWRPNANEGLVAPSPTSPETFWTKCDNLKHELKHKGDGYQKFSDNPLNSRLARSLKLNNDTQKIGHYCGTDNTFEVPAFCDATPRGDAVERNATAATHERRERWASAAAR